MLPFIAPGGRCCIGGCCRYHGEHEGQLQYEKEASRAREGETYRRSKPRIETSLRTKSSTAVDSHRTSIALRWRRRRSTVMHRQRARKVASSSVLGSSRAGGHAHGRGSRRGSVRVHGAVRLAGERPIRDYRCESGVRVWSARGGERDKKEPRRTDSNGLRNQSRLERREIFLHVH